MGERADLFSGKKIEEKDEEEENDEKRAIVQIEFKESNGWVLDKVQHFETMDRWETRVQQQKLKGHICKNFRVWVKKNVISKKLQENVSLRNDQNDLKSYPKTYNCLHQNFRMAH